TFKIERRSDDAWGVVALHDDADGVATSDASPGAHLTVYDHVVMAVAHRKDGTAKGEVVDRAGDGHAGARAECALHIERDVDAGRFAMLILLQQHAKTLGHGFGSQSEPSLIRSVPP